MSAVEQSEAWLQWRQAVSEEDREGMSAIVRELNSEGFKGVNQLIDVMMDQVLQGKISPIAMEMMQGLIDRQMASLFMEHKQANALDMFPQSASSAMLELERATIQLKPVKPQYAELQPPSPVEMLEAEIVETKQLVEKK